MHYFEAASRRIERRARSEFEGWVEAVRIGTLFAYDAKGYRKWASRPKPGRKAPSDDQLERQILNLAAMFPGQVTRVSA